MYTADPSRCIFLHNPAGHCISRSSLDSAGQTYAMRRGCANALRSASARAAARGLRVPGSRVPEAINNSTRLAFVFAAALSVSLLECLTGLRFVLHCARLENPERFIRHLKSGQQPLPNLAPEPVEDGICLLFLSHLRIRKQPPGKGRHRGAPFQESEKRYLTTTSEIKKIYLCPCFSSPKCEFPRNLPGAGV